MSQWVSAGWRPGRAIPAVLLLLASAGVSMSCAAIARLRFEPLTVELQRLRLDHLDTRGGAVTLYLEVFNPNSYAIRGTRIEADLQVDDTRLGGSWVEGEFVLAKTTHTMLEVPVRFTWEGVGATARSLLGRGAVSYDLETLIRIDVGPEFRNLRFRKSGEVDIMASGG